MTIEQLGEIIQKRVPVVHIATIKKYIDLAYGELIYSLFRSVPANLDLYAKPYIAEVERNPVTEVYYSALPVAPVQFPGSANGVRHIYQTRGSDITFAAQEQGAYEIFDTLDVAAFDNTVGYTLGIGVVSYDRNPGTTEVRMMIVPNPSSLAPHEEFYLPSGASAKLVDLVINLINGTPPENLRNDNTHN